MGCSASKKKSIIRSLVDMEQFLKAWHITVYNSFAACALFGAVQMSNVQQNVAVHCYRPLNIKTVYQNVSETHDSTSSV
jgi:predicted transcriptional regulator